MLSLLFARRYLFSAKSHSVINIISAVSVFAVGIPVAAMIVLMSVFNGFAGLVESMYTAFDADLALAPREGKTFMIESVDTAAIARIDGVEAVAAVLEQSALAEYGGRQSVVTVRGVDDRYRDVLPIEGRVASGEYALRLGEIEQALVGQGIAYNLGVRLFLDTPLNLYSPRRGEISTLLPIDAYTHRKAYPSGIFALDAQTDSRYVLTTLEFAQSLFDYSDRASGLLVAVRKGAAVERIRREAERITQGKMTIRTRQEQQAAMYRIMNYEKWGIFFISLLVLVIASFSIVGSLAMLIIDKRDNIATLRAMGARTAFVRRIFTCEGMLIGVLGAALGLLLGVGVCLLQQKLGLVQIPADTFVVRSYPVVMKLRDIIIILAAMAAVTFAITRLTVCSMIRSEKTIQPQ